MIRWHTHKSNAIRGFPMGDPHERSFPVYLPPGYNAKRRAPYPVVFMLAGWGGRGSHYLSQGLVFSTPLEQRLDEAIAARRLAPLILVFPDGGSKFGCSQYVNSPALGNYTDYICDELVDFIDRKYHTHRSADYRGIAGHSSGGFGALVCGLLRPERFPFLCSSAGDSFYEVSFLKNINAIMIELEAAGGVAPFIKMFLKSPNPWVLPTTKIETMLTLSMAPCYAPNLSRRPLLGDLFFDVKTGAVLPEIWEKYMTWDPVRMVDRYSANARKLRFVHLAAGLQDEHALQWGHRQIAEKLKAHRVPHDLEEYPGGHGGHHWRFESRLITMLRKMGLPGAKRTA